MRLRVYFLKPVSFKHWLWRLGEQSAGILDGAIGLLTFGLVGTNLNTLALFSLLREELQHEETLT